MNYMYIISSHHIIDRDAITLTPLTITVKVPHSIVVHKYVAFIYNVLAGHKSHGSYYCASPTDT